MRSRDNAAFTLTPRNSFALVESVLAAEAVIMIARDRDERELKSRVVFRHDNRDETRGDFPARESAHVASTIR